MNQDGSFTFRFLHRVIVTGSHRQIPRVRRERAMQDFDKAIELNPQLALAHMNKGWAYINLGQFERAIDSLDEAIKLDPGESVAYYNRAASYEQLGHREQAKQDIERAKRLSPESTGRSAFGCLGSVVVYLGYLVGLIIGGGLFIGALYFLGYNSPLHDLEGLESTIGVVAIIGAMLAGLAIVAAIFRSIARRWGFTFANDDDD